MTKISYTQTFQTRGQIIMSGELQDILIRHWLFSVLPGRVISDLSNQFSTRRFLKDQYVFHQNDEARNLFVIIEGEVSIESINLDGKITKISQLHEGDIFGEFALIDGKCRSASANVVKKSVLASLSSNVFFTLIEDYPAFSKTLMKVLVARLRGSNKQVESLVTMSLLQRTAQILLSISSRSGPEISITQNILANQLYATREKVNSKLKELERLGAIKTGHGKIIIENSFKLSSVIEIT